MQRLRLSGRIDKVLVLGVGNILLRDEGVGVRAVEYMLNRYSAHEAVSFVDGGTGGLNLLSLLKGFGRVIIIDAVTPAANPGRVLRVLASDMSASISLKSTAHGIGVKDALAIAKFEGSNPHAVIIGVEPEDISMGLDLSATVKRALPEVARMAVKELEGFGVVLREKTDGA